MAISAAGIWPALRTRPLIVFRADETGPPQFGALWKTVGESRPLPDFGAACFNRLEGVHDCRIELPAALGHDGVPRTLVWPRLLVRAP